MTMSTFFIGLLRVVRKESISGEEIDAIIESVGREEIAIRFKSCRLRYRIFRG